MVAFLTGNLDGYLQFITVLIIFVLVLAVTAFTTRWIANYQKQQNKGANIEVLETTRIANNKYIQLVRIGGGIFAVAVCKDSVTLLGEIPGDQIKEGATDTGFQFKDFLDRSLKKREFPSGDSKESRSDEEM